ncbi:MAG: cobalamin-dependent protein [Desulfatiglandaceae bacterium]|jgi:5-methyltetrahydrofolate--homocysteine methyltransferase
MDWIKRLHEAVVKGQKREIAGFAAEALKEGMSASAIVDEAVIPAMNKVSELWRNEEYFVPEVMRSASTMQVCMDALKPLLVTGEHGKDLKVAIGTVKGDLHDIGKNLVAIMLEGAGFQVENMGVDLPPEQFLEAAQRGAKVIGLSSLLTTSMPGMGTVIELFETSGLKENVTFLVGGAPVTANFAREIGADHYAENAAEAVAVLNNLFDSDAQNP